MSEFHFRLRQHMPLRLVINWIKMITLLELVLFLVGIIGTSWFLWNESNVPFPTDWVAWLLLLSVVAGIASSWVIDVFTKPEISQSPHKTAIRLISALVQVFLLFLVVDISINIVQASFLSRWYDFSLLKVKGTLELLLRFLGTGLWMLDFTLAVLFIYVPPLQDRLEPSKLESRKKFEPSDFGPIPESLEVSKKGKYWMIAIFLLLLGGVMLEWQSLVPSVGWGINLGIGSAILTFFTWQFWKKEDLTTLGIVIFPFILPGLIAGLFFAPLLGNFLLTPFLAFSYVIAQLLAVGLWYLNYQFVMKMFTHHFVRGISFLSTKDIHDLWKVTECQFLNLSSYDWVLEHATNVILLKTPHYQFRYQAGIHGSGHRERNVISTNSDQVHYRSKSFNQSSRPSQVWEEFSDGIADVSDAKKTTRKLLPRETRKAIYLAMMHHTEEAEWRFVEDGCEALVFLYWLNSFSDADQVLDAILNEAIHRQKTELLEFWLLLHHRLIKKVNLSSHHWARFVSLLEEARYHHLVVPALLSEFETIRNLDVDVDPCLAWLTRQLVLGSTGIKWKTWYQHFVNVLKDGQSIPLTMLELLRAKHWTAILQKAWMQWALVHGEEVSLLMMFFGMTDHARPPSELQFLLSLEAILGMISEEDATLVWLQLSYF